MLSFILSVLNFFCLRCSWEASYLASTALYRNQTTNQDHFNPSYCLGDARLKVTATATGGTVLIPDPEVTTFRPCSMMDDFVIIGELVFLFVSRVLLLCLLSTFFSLHPPLSTVPFHPAFCSYLSLFFTFSLLIPLYPSFYLPPSSSFPSSPSLLPLYPFFPPQPLMDYGM
jgi:hypothetical protein